MTAERLSHHPSFYHPCVFLLSTACFIIMLPSAQAQQVNLVPSSSSAQDLPAGSDADHKKLIQVRAQAQQARRDAQLAALQRSATQSTDKNNRDQILQKARLDKEFKRRAALAVQQQKAINAYEKVKQEEIDSWKGKGKYPRVTRGVPENFTASLPPLEKDKRKRKGLLSGIAAAPGMAIKGLSSLRPGFLGGKKKKKATAAEPASQFASPGSLSLDSVSPHIPAPTPEVESEPIEQPEKRGFRIPLISKLTGGKKQDANPYVAEENTTAPQQLQPVPDPTEANTPPGEKKGFFKGIASRIPLVGNKNKNNKTESGAYYGPDGGAEIAEEPKSGFLSKLSLKRDRDSDDPMPGDGTKEQNSSTRKNIYIVDSDKAQFFPFGQPDRQADAQTLSEGTIIRKTKSGSEWSSIELASGTMGVIRNKHLRRAKAGEVPPRMFAHNPKTPYPTTARISKSRSATGKGTSHRYREPVNVPLPDLPTGGAGSDSPIGNGLLPPLNPNSTIQ